jgi:hypothetical protein
MEVWELFLSLDLYILKANSSMLYFRSLLGGLGDQRERWVVGIVV